MAETREQKLEYLREKEAELKTMKEGVNYMSDSDPMKSLTVGLIDALEKGIAELKAELALS